jgi:hypothetical protein
METEGLLAPETVEAARSHYEALGPQAQVLVKEVAKAMALDADAYEQRVDADVVATAREVMFASRLEVHTGTRAEFDAWVADREESVTELGSEHVDHVAWHRAQAVGEIVATTYQNERAAAVETLRRQALGRCYREVL